MKKRIIANPPIGFYDQFETKMKHGFFLYLGDTIARQKIEAGENVIFPNYSFNMFGKKSENFIEREESFDEYNEKIKKLSLEMIDKNDFRYLFNLSSNKMLFDNEDDVMRGVSEDFVRLFEKGYILQNGDSHYLDCKKIKNDFDLIERIKEIRIPSKKARFDLERFVENNLSEPHRITRNTFYSIKNPIDENMENIAPLFTLANLWDHKYPNSDYTILSSDNVLAKYVFLRILTRTALDNDPGFDELIVWPRVNLSEGDESWDLKKIIKDGYDSDMLRISLLSLYPSQRSSVNLNLERLKGSRKFVYSLANLRNIIPYDKDAKILDKKYLKEASEFKYPQVLNLLEKEVCEISREVNRIKNEDSGNFERLSHRYSSLVTKLSPFMPATTDLVRQEGIKI